MSADFSDWFRQLLTRHYSDDAGTTKPVEMSRFRREQLLDRAVSPARRGQPRLVVRRSIASSAKVGAREFLLRPRSVLGRAASSDIVVAESSVSREHCELLREGETLVVRDLGSSNGVSVNGLRIEGAVALKSGDRLSIADDVVVFECMLGAKAQEDDEDIAQSESAPAAVLPVAILAPLLEVMVAETQLARLKAAAQAIEVHLKFAIACALAASDGTRDLESIRSTLGKPVSTGSWVAILVDVARCGAGGDSRLRSWFDWFADPLVRCALNDAVAARNRSVGHGATARDGAYDEEESLLFDALSILTGVATDSELIRYRAVAVTRAQIDLDSDGFEYTVLRACGIRVDPRPVTLRSRQRLGDGWLYLVDEHSEQAPLSLSPFFYLDTCRTCGEREVFAAPRPVFGPKGAVVELEGITTGHRTSAPIAWDARAQASWEALGGSRGE